MSRIPVVDPVTAQLINYVRLNLGEIVPRILSRGRKPQPIAGRMFGAIGASEEGTREDLLSFAKSIREIVSHQDRWPFLYLFRKIPVTVAMLILRDQPFAGCMAVAERGVLYATNQIIGLAETRTLLMRPLGRYRWQYGSNDYDAALSLFVLALLHAHQQFFLNSVVRRSLVQLVSFDTLVESYDSRLHAQRAIPRPESVRKHGIIFPTLLHRKGEEQTPTTFSLFDSSETEHVVLLRNWVPGIWDAESEKREYAFLNCDDFSACIGLPFSVFWNLWITLNEVLKQNLALFWSQKHARVHSTEDVRGVMEKQDDYCECALGATWDDGLIRALSQLHSQIFGTIAEASAVATFVSTLTAKLGIDNVEFIEQPFVFYRTGPKTLFWDYLRHGALLKAIARLISSNPTYRQMGNLLGSEFEQEIRQRLVDVPGVCVVEWSGRIKRVGGGWQIDVTAEKNGIIFLIEAKHRFKRVGYDAAKESEVSDRVTDVEGWLEKQDGKLREFKSALQEKLRPSTPDAQGALCVVCSSEVEFITSTSPEWWLVPFRIPRACTIDELLQFLGACTPADLDQHPAFVRFDA